jgi:ATP-binding cassette subfamily B protein
MRPFPFYRQKDSMDCGPTCLQMIAKHYGKSILLQALREQTQIGKAGVNLLGISEASENIGFRTRAIKLNYTSLVNDAPLPCILYWKQNHFIVLYKVRKRLFFSFGRSRDEVLLIADPAHGLAKLTKQEFLQGWVNHKSENEADEGIALLLEPTPNFFEHDEDPLSFGERHGRTHKGKSLAFKNILLYLFPYKKLVLQLFIGLAVASMLQLLLPFLTQSIVDVGIATLNINFVYIVLLAQAALFVGRLVTDFVRSWILLHISTRINISIVTDFLIKLMKLSVSFFDSKKTGDILQRMNDHQRIESFLTSSSINVLFSFANLVIFSIALSAFNTYIFSVFLLASVFYAAWVGIFLKSRKVLDYKRFDIASREQSATIQILQGMQEIKLNGVERAMRWNWERLQAKLFQVNMKGLALNQWQQLGATFINEGKNIFITFISAKAVIDGQMTLGAMLAVQYIIGQLNSPIEQMIGFVQSWQNAKISMDRLNEIHGMEDEEPLSEYLLQALPLPFSRRLMGGSDGLPTDIVQAEKMACCARDLIKANTAIPLSLNESKEDLENGAKKWSFHPNEESNETSIILSNLSFTYSGAGNEAVLRDINLKIPKGKTTAIVGMSGSGKTTLIKLLLKFYEPQKGDIKLNATSLTNISHKIWRAHCGVVLQDSFIFSDTIARNIAVGVGKIDMSQLQHAVVVANIDDFIESLPLGFNTKIGSEGTSLSMGQRQRILIARAIYRNPEFIFLDEATNSLDANNEGVILRNLESFLKNRTVVVVAHRLSTVKKADQIVVLDKGVIAERGTHLELVELKGFYYTLVKNQLELGE